MLALPSLWLQGRRCWGRGGPGSILERADPLRNLCPHILVELRHGPRSEDALAVPKVLAPGDSGQVCGPDQHARLVQDVARMILSVCCCVCPGPGPPPCPHGPRRACCGQKLPGGLSGPGALAGMGSPAEPETGGGLPGALVGVRLRRSC